MEGGDDHFKKLIKIQEFWFQSQPAIKYQNTVKASKEQMTPLFLSS